MIKNYLIFICVWLLPINAHSFEFSPCPAITKNFINNAQNVMAGKVLSINEHKNDKRFQEVIFQNEFLWRGVSSYGKKQNGIIHLLVKKYPKNKNTTLPLSHFPYGEPVFNFKPGKRYIILAQYGKKYKVPFPVIENRCGNAIQLDAAYENGALDQIYKHLSNPAISFENRKIACVIDKTAKSYQQADFVFSGKVMANKTSGYQTESLFLVEKVWKVPDIENVRVFQNVYTTSKDDFFCGLLNGDLGCGVKFEEDAHYIVFGNLNINSSYFKHPVGFESIDQSMPTIVTSYCTGTRKLNKLKETKIPSIPIFEFRSNLDY